ncbi:GPI inositol-deacylase [Dermacentor andersoni]|uniref:GPI inositol-deacylase n=1 Tax=Dermacentor andersoni TaxID=34620 RepID=UPI0024163914|nr:GPI inositol-deacylase-like [Dermacentor andersoni]
MKFYFGVKALVGLCALVLLFTGFIDVLTINWAKNECEMTYMFELPEYIPIKLSKEVQQKYPRYRLVVYGEGVYARQLRRGHLRGVPVLFVPGNAGSYQQVRSIGTVLLRKAEFEGLPYRFDVFATDFQGELSGLYGPLLRDQIGFLHECIRTIRRLYKSTPNASLVVLGHSMGGVVARSLFTLEDFEPDSVSLIMSYATPHHSAAILDSHLNAVYERIREAWSPPRLPVIMVSVAGGRRDTLVRTELTRLEPHVHHISTTSTAVPGVWASADHLTIVWCQQLVVTSARVLFDLITRENRQVRLTNDPGRIKAVVDFHFVRRPYGKQLPAEEANGQPIYFGSSGEWSDHIESSWRVHKQKVLVSRWLVMPVRESDQVVLRASGLGNKEWLYGCTAVRKEAATGKLLCTMGVSLSREGATLPYEGSYGIERRGFHASGAELRARGLRALVVHVRPTTSKMTVVGERLQSSERWRDVRLPPWWGSSKVLLTVPLTEGAAFYNLSLHGLWHPWQAYHFILQSKICRTGTEGDGFVRFLVPWGSEDLFFHIRYPMGSRSGPKETPMLVHVQSGAGTSDGPPPQLHLYLDPECSYELRVEAAWKTSLGQMMRRHITMVPSYCVAITLALLAEQLLSVHTSGVCLDFNCALQKAESFLELTLLASLAEYFFQSLSEEGSVLVIDSMATTSPWENLVLRVSLYCIGCGAVYVLGTLITGSTYISAIAVNRVLAMVRGTQRSPPPGKQPWSPRVFLLVAGLLLLIVATCAAMALFLGSIVFAIRLVYQCARQTAQEERRGPSSETSGWRLQLCLLHLWLWVAVLGLPAVIVWFSVGPLSPQPGGADPLAVTATFLLLAQAVLWQPFVPNPQGLYYRPVAWLCRILSFACVLLSPVRMYRAAPLIAVAYVALALQQLLSPQQLGHKAD